MFKQIVDAIPYATDIIIEKDNRTIASFHSSRQVIGQIDTDNVKDVRISYDQTNCRKVIIVEV